jgi:hypothetical protein
MQRIPKAVNLDFLDPEPLLFHSSSSSVDPVPDPLLLRKSGGAENRFVHKLILKSSDEGMLHLVLLGFLAFVHCPVLY